VLLVLVLEWYVSSPTTLLITHSRRNPLILIRTSYSLLLSITYTHYQLSWLLQGGMPSTSHGGGSSSSYGGHNEGHSGSYGGSSSSSSSSSSRSHGGDRGPVNNPVQQVYGPGQGSDNTRQQQTRYAVEDTTNLPCQHTIIIHPQIISKTDPLLHH